MTTIGSVVWAENDSRRKKRTGPNRGTRALYIVLPNPKPESCLSLRLEDRILLRSCNNNS